MAWMRISLSIALLCVAAPLSAQGYVGGFVLDSATKAPLPCVVVALLDTAGHAVARQLTIDNGAFQFDAPLAARTDWASHSGKTRRCSQRARSSIPPRSMRAPMHSTFGW